MKKIIWAVSIMLLLCFNVCAGEAETDVRFALGTTAIGTVGCDTPEGSELYKADIGVNYRKDLGDHFYWDREGYIPIIYSDTPDESAVAFGAGFRIRGGYKIFDEWKIFLGAGVFTLITNNDKVQNLGESPLYGSLEGGVEYKNFTIGIDHGSSPFHDADDGDEGFNNFYVAYQIHF